MKTILIASVLAFLAVFPMRAGAESGVDPSPADFSSNQILKLTDKGLEPPVLRMKKSDSILFFLNASSDSLVTLAVDYNGKHTHCSSHNLEVDKDKMVRSIRPFGPRDFASVCFHEAGTYPVTVWGLRSNPEGIHSQIIVE